MGVIEAAYWGVFVQDVGWLVVAAGLYWMAPRGLKRTVVLSAAYFTLELLFHGEAERGVAALLQVFG